MLITTQKTLSRKSDFSFLLFFPPPIFFEWLACPKNIECCSTVSGQMFFEMGEVTVLVYVTWSVLCYRQVHCVPVVCADCRGVNWVWQGIAAAMPWFQGGKNVSKFTHFCTVN